MMELFALRNRIPVDSFLRGMDLSRVLQLMHGEAVKVGGMFQWTHFPDPEPELMARFETACAETSAAAWNELEPQPTT